MVLTLPGKQIQRIGQNPSEFSIYRHVILICDLLLRDAGNGQNPIQFLILSRSNTYVSDCHRAIAANLACPELNSGGFLNGFLAQLDLLCTFPPTHPSAFSCAGC